MIGSQDIFQEILIMSRFTRRQVELGGKIGNTAIWEHRSTGDVVHLWTSVICFY